MTAEQIALSFRSEMARLEVILAILEGREPRKSLL